MMAAYGWVSNIENLDEGIELLEALKKTYGAGNENIVNDSLSLNIDLRMDYMGANVLEGIDSLADEDEEDYEDDYE